MFSLDVHNQEGSSSSRSRPDAHGSRGAQGGWKTPSPASSYWLLQGGVQALHALPLVLLTIPELIALELGLFEHLGPLIRAGSSNVPSYIPFYKNIIEHTSIEILMKI